MSQRKPLRNLIFEISLLSVDTITLSKAFDLNAASIDQTIIGLPQKSRIFLFLILFEPPRAGTMARRLGKIESEKM